MYDRLGLTGTARTKRVPSWVYELALPLRLAYLRGYLDSDGTVDGTRGQITYASANSDLVADVRYLCISCGIPVSNVMHDVGRQGNFGAIEIHRFCCGYEKYNHLIGSNCPKRTAKLRREGMGRYGGKRDGRYQQGVTYQLRSLRLPSGVGLSRVTEVNFVGVQDVYDLATFGSHTFIAEGVVVHNTAMSDKLMFYTNVVIPRAEWIAERVNKQLLAPLGVMMEFDPSRLEVMQWAEVQKAQSLSALVGGAAILTVGEARSQLGYDPIPDAVDPALVALHDRIQALRDRVVNRPARSTLPAPVLNGATPPQEVVND